MRPLLQGDSPISWEFTPDAIIAVRLQPAAASDDERRQVKRAPSTVPQSQRCARVMSIGGGARCTLSDTICSFSKLPQSCGTVPSLRNRCPRAVFSLAAVAAMVIRCFVVNREVAPPCERHLLLSHSHQQLEPHKPEGDFDRL